MATTESDVADSAGAVLSQLDTLSSAFENGLLARLANVHDLPADWERFVAALGSHQLAPWSLALIAVGAFLVTHLVSRLLLSRIGGRFSGATGWRRGLAVLASVFATLLLMVVLTRLAIGDETVRSVARLWVLANLIFWLARAGLSFVLRAHQGGDGAANSAAVGRFERDLDIVLLFALCGIALVSSMPVFAFGAGLRDLLGTGLVVLLLALLVRAYWRGRETVSALILAPKPTSRFLQKLAAAWPWIAIGVVLITVLGSQAALTIGKPLPPLATFVTLLLVLIAPHLDTVAADWAERGLESPDVSVLVVAWRRTIRFLVAVTLFALLAYFWVTPIFSALGFGAPSIAAGVAEVVFIILFCAFLWNAVGSFSGRVARVERLPATELDAGESPPDAAHDAPHEGPRSRISTVLPLIVGTSKAAILSMGLLSVMIAVGINVVPILGGLSVFGLAIGFGSQTLVKDIVAGLFFLTDDAFRLGEYIETSGSKGTVEKISIRSLSLRSPRGAVATVPYGQIGKVINFSREWVIEKYVFRVAFDTDVDLVRKLFKKIGQEIAENPEFAPDLLEPFKSQGIGMVEDGTLVLRGKFKARAGKQFGIKKAVMAAVTRAFTENGIKAVPKPLLR